MKVTVILLYPAARDEFQRTPWDAGSTYIARLEKEWVSFGHEEAEAALKLARAEVFKRLAPAERAGWKHKDFTAVAAYEGWNVLYSPVDNCFLPVAQVKTGCRGHPIP